MNIPWIAALQVAKKLLPVVVDHAPELMKTIGRLRTPAPAESATADSRLDALQEQIDAHRRTIAMQATTIEELQAALRTTERSLAVARSTGIALALLLLASCAYLLFHF
ncbi:MAG: hypothetical protein JSR62_14020 [Nitrospira sp.]|nr:hypothetical protein [Nitrospira sp.]